MYIHTRVVLYTRLHIHMYMYMQRRRETKEGETNAEGQRHVCVGLLQPCIQHEVDNCLLVSGCARATAGFGRPGKTERERESERERRRAIRAVTISIIIYK